MKMKLHLVSKLEESLAKIQIATTSANRNQTQRFKHRFEARTSHNHVMNITSEYHIHLVHHMQDPHFRQKNRNLRF